MACDPTPSVEYTTMRKLLILLALAVLMAESTGCSRCRGLFRRGSPCGGTRLASPGLLGGAVPLGQPMAVPQMVPQGMVAQPQCAAPACIESCPEMCNPCEGSSSFDGCVPCESGYGGGDYGSGDCGCQDGGGGYFGGYVEGGAPTMMDGTIIDGGTIMEEGSVLPEGSSTYPGPAPTN